VGELDLSTVDALQTELEDALAADWRTVVLDLRGVSFVDSTGLGLLLRSHERFQEQGVDFAIIEDPGPVRRLLELAGVSHLFKRASPRRT
jgi:anti-anti-sigma factor